MNEARSRNGRKACAWADTVLVVAVVALGMLSSGCFVLTSERRNKPDALCEQIKVDRNSDGLMYCRRLKYPDFTLDVGVENGPPRWQMGFLFYVLPIRQSFDYLDTEPVRVQM